MGGPESITLAFQSVQGLIYKAHERPLTQKDLLPLAGYMQAGTILRQFEAMMATMVWRAPKEHPPVAGGSFQQQPSDDDFVELKTAEEVAHAIATSKDRMRLYATQGYSLIWLMFRLCGRHLLIGMAMGVCRSCAVILQVWSLWTIIRIANNDPEYNYGKPLQYIIGALLPFGAFVQSFLQHNCFHVGTRAALIMRVAASSLIFAKLGVLTPVTMGSDEKVKVSQHHHHGHSHGKKPEEAKATDNLPRKIDADGNEIPADSSAKPTTSAAPPLKEQPTSSMPSGVSTGQLINMFSSDTNTIVEAVIMGPMSFASITDLFICIIWIGWVIGWTAAPLAGTVLLILGFQLFDGKQVANNKINVSRVADSRLRSLTEFLSGIQVVKFYAWEVNVRKMIGALRIEEANLHIVGNIWKLLGLATIFFSGGIFSLVTFAVKLSYDDEMLPADTFVTMALIANITRSFQMLPRAISCLGTSVASMQRIQSFLAKDVITGLAEPNVQEPAAQSTEPAADESEMVSKNPDLIKGLHVAGDFGWSGFSVKNLNLICPEGTLTVVIGSVGSGKSTLLQAVLGVCAAVSPNYTLQLPGDGSVAYVAQEAFIYDSTVRENITFGKPFDEAKYRRVIKACSLVTDLQQWGGDLVEVTGNTLSGGQRQRLSLARACYADAALYIVDDPISAVDASVGRHLLRHCFRGYLKGKTVLLATHHPAPARFADQVVLMELGTARVCPVSSSTKEAVRQLTTEHPEVTNDSLAVADLAEAMSKLETDSASAGHPDLGDLEDEADDNPQMTEQDALLDGLIGKARVLHSVEAEAAGAVSLDVYKAYIKGGGVAMGVVTISLFVLAQGVRSVQDWWFSAWTRRTFPELSNDQSLYILGILVGCLIIVGCLRTFTFGYFTIRASSSLHDRMFEAVIASPLHFFEEVPLGRIMNRFSKDLDYCDDMLPRTLFDFLQLMLMIVGALALLVYSIPWFAIAIPVAFTIFGYLVWAYMPASRYMKRIEGTSRSPTMNTFQTVIGGLTTLRVYKRLDYFQEVFFKSSNITTNALLHSNFSQRWMGIRMDWVAVLWVACAVFMCVGLMDSLGPSLIGLCLSQSIQLTGLLQYSIRMAAETENLMTSAERLNEYGQLPAEENKGNLKAAPAAGEGSAAVSVVDSLPASWPEDCDILAKGLTMAYHSNPGVPVLRDLHFTIRAGQRVAVVGRTGAGKSSLLSAFYRTVAIPDGSLRIGGVSTTDIDVFSLRSKLGIIPQVPTLFHGTFRYNLDPFGLYSDEAMLEALRKVRLDDYVAARSGLDTSVGDGGGNLSVGQKQLLCAARVLLTGASILFMDEATANIDEETDAQIQQIVREEASRRRMTVITIAHRLNTIMDYDLVLVMSQGRLVEYGNPQALVAAGTEAPLGGTATGVVSTEDFTTDVRSLDEVRQFARMVQVMNESHAN